VTACSDARWGFGITHEARRAFELGEGDGPDGVDNQSITQSINNF